MKKLCIWLLLILCTATFGAIDGIEEVFKADDVTSYQAYVKEKSIHPLELFNVVNKNKRDISDHSYTMLYLAVKYKSTKIAKAILDSLASEELQKVYVKRMFLRACELSSSDDSRMAELFLCYDIDVNYADENNYTPLIALVRYANLQAVKLVLSKGANPYASYQSYASKNGDALSFAVNRGNAPIVKYLLDNYNYDLNKTFEHKHITSYVPMLYHLTYSPEKLELFERILNSIDPKIITRDGSKLLYEINDNKKAIEIAVKNRAFRAVFDDEVYKHLYFAYKDWYAYQDTDYIGTKDILAKAKRQISNYESYIADDDIVTRLKRIDAIKDEAVSKELFYLMEAHRAYDELIDKDSKDTGFGALKNYLLIEAAYRGDIKGIQKLLDGGADLNYHKQLGKQSLRVLYPINPLLAAAKGKKYESVEYLLKNGADIKTQDWYKQNALVYALNKADKKDRALIELLLKSGVDANVQFDEYGYALSEVYFRPFDYALSFTHDIEIVKSIARYADTNLSVGADRTPILNWLTNWHRDGFEFSCDRFVFALSVSADKEAVPYHNDTVLENITKAYNHRSIYDKCSQNDLLNIYFKTDKSYSKDEINGIAKAEKERIKAYTAKRDYALTLLANKEFDKLYRHIQNCTDITTLAKSKSESFIRNVLSSFKSWSEIFGSGWYFLPNISASQILEAVQSKDKTKLARISEKYKLKKEQIDALLANQERVKIAKLLISKGADVNQLGMFSSYTPHQYTKEFKTNHPEFAELEVLMSGK
ncbi:MAG: ankyrin repeat domain-containing protein [Campylobacterales bacterium]|nr:ankyrin repeat domain-containing protein [Campylobacterales bacterium]